MSKLLFNSNEREERIRKILRAYEIFLFQSYKINIVDGEANLEFCKKYKNAINEVFRT